MDSLSSLLQGLAGLTWQGAVMIAVGLLLI